MRLCPNQSEIQEKFTNSQKSKYLNVVENMKISMPDKRIFILDFSLLYKFGNSKYYSVFFAESDGRDGIGRLNDFSYTRPNFEKIFL